MKKTSRKIKFISILVILAIFLSNSNLNQNLSNIVEKENNIPSSSVDPTTIRTEDLFGALSSIRMTHTKGTTKINWEMYFGVGINTLNAYFRKQDQEENPELYPEKMSVWDYTMFNNTLGHKTHLFTGRYDDGTERYLRWGKF